MDGESDYKKVSDMFLFNKLRKELDECREKNRGLLESVHNCLIAAGAPEGIDELRKHLNEIGFLQPGCKPSRYIVALRERSECLEEIANAAAKLVENQKNGIMDPLAWDTLDKLINKHNG